MRITLIIAMILTTLSLAVVEGDARKKHRVEAERVGSVRIDYYGNDALVNYFYAVMVTDLNAATASMPRAPAFWMSDRQNKACSQLPWPVPDNVYQVCTSPYIDIANGLTWSNPVRRAANIQIENSAATWYKLTQIICHETMHATTGVLDSPNDDAERSCTDGHFNATGKAFMNWWWG